MNKLTPVLMAIIVGSLLMLAFSPMFAVTVPDELHQILLGAATLLVVGALKWVSDRVPWIPRLENAGAVIAASIVSILVTLANQLLTGIPIQYEGLANSLFQALIIFLTATGLFNFWRRGRSYG